MPPNDQDNAVTSHKKHFKFKKWHYLIAIIVLIGLVTTAVIIFNKPEPTIVIGNKLVSSLILNEPQKVYDLTTSSFREQTSYDELKQQMNLMAKNLGNGKFQMIDQLTLSSNGQKTTRILVYQVNAGSNKYYIRAILEETDQNSWQISNFKYSEKVLAAQE